MSDIPCATLQGKDTDSQNALLKAITEGDFTVAIALLTLLEGITDRDAHGGRNDFMAFVSRIHAECMKALRHASSLDFLRIDNDADIERRDIDENVTPLYNAVLDGHYDEVRGHVYVRTYKCYD